MRYLLDTDTFSLLVRGSIMVRTRLATVAPSDVVLSVVTIEEQISGRIAFIRQAKDRANIVLGYNYLTQTTEALKILPIVSFSDGAYDHFERLKAAKLNVGGNDLRIAAIALDLGITVVTRNTRDFGRVPNLNIENWAD